MTQDGVLILDAAHLAELRAFAEAAHPEEACGLLVGRRLGGQVVASRVVASPNRHADPRRSFEIDPATHFALLRRLRDQVVPPGQTAEEIIGHYHSHPDAPPGPSLRDYEQAHDPDMIWVILSLRAGRSEAVGAWRIDRRLAPPAAFLEVPIISDGKKKTLLAKGQGVT